ncbi:MAG: type II toxin-antitoxin system HicA family toxin [Anaerolineae bacterium]
MKLPRDVSGDELVKRLAMLEYHPTRQTGSHVRLTRSNDDEHHITVPSHKTLKVGTLNSILRDVAEHLQMSKDELIRTLWE